MIKNIYFSCEMAKEKDRKNNDDQTGARSEGSTWKQRILLHSGRSHYYSALTTTDIWPPLGNKEREGHQKRNNADSLKNTFGFIVDFEYIIYFMSIREFIVAEIVQHTARRMIDYGIERHEENGRWQKEKKTELGVLKGFTLEKLPC